MPSIRLGVVATTADALANQTFAVVPEGGAILNLFASSVSNGDTIGLSLGNRQLLLPSEVNTVAADIINANGFDQMLFGELVGPGRLVVPVAVTTELQFLIALRYLAA